VSYNDKHNDANQEGSNDGTNDNHSWNMGAEGPTDDPQIIERRERQKRNFLATLLLSQGVPMILGGDEIGHTQNGNNNAYCQDDEITWLDWSLDEHKIALVAFTQKLIQMRKDHPSLHRRKFYQGRAIRGTEEKDLVWLRPDGQEMSDEEWGLGWVRCLGLLLNGKTIGEVDDSGEPIIDDTFLIMLNCHHEPIQFFVPETPNAEKWEIVLDTNEPGLEPNTRCAAPGTAVDLVALSLVVCRIPEEPPVSRLLTTDRQ